MDGVVAACRRYPALDVGFQVAWTNHDGQWPWDQRWADRRRRQELFGRPPRAAA